MAGRRPQSAWELLGLIGYAMWSVLKGMWLTLRVFFRPKVTQQYPFKDPTKEWRPAPGYRGDFALISDPERPGGTRCIACLACQNICPNGCIHIAAEGKGKERHPSSFYIDIGLCMYCWLCVETCPVGALTMTPDYHNVEYVPQRLIRDLEDLKQRGAGIAEPLVPVAPEKTTLASAKRGATAGEGSGEER